MKKYIRTVLALCAGATVVASAMAEPANPLVRPSTGTAASSGGAAPGGMPPPPRLNSAGLGGGADKDQAKETQRMEKLRTTLAAYVVVAISDKTAVLRAIPGASVAGASTSGSGSGGAGASPTGGGGAGGGSAAGGTSPASSSTSAMLPSIIVTHDKTMLVEGIEVLPVIRNGQVLLGSAKEAYLLYNGRLDSTATSHSAYALVPEDKSYVERQSPPLGKMQAESTGSSVPATGAAK